ncbi:DNA-3-methyladenine glycosylase family protein [Actinokineospora enzanensis]|uniref:DNA-3-methyladenine glycosylase family protein n=1 Tax=Actinokineospora enzanensis TaxID=155975 RepID=UPI00039EDDF3|nr:DNA-3-methyladenine glycosylase [Actinokineospora enzanensis]
MTPTTALMPTSMVLPVTAPFDFTATLRFIGAFPATAGEQTVAPRALTKALRENGTVVGARLSASDGALRCELTTADPDTVEAVANRLTSHLGLDDDLTEFYARAAADPPFARVVARLHGYHQVKFPSPLELFCWAVLCQRVPLPLARRTKQAIVDHFANTVTLDGVTLSAFPDLDQLLSLDEPTLQRLIGNPRKAGYLHAGLRGWAELDEEYLRTGAYVRVRDSLLALPGIGPWSANFILIRGLGRMDRAEPDKEALRAAAKVYGPVTASEFTRLATHYGPHQGYWAHYLRAGS